MLGKDPFIAATNAFANAAAAEKPSFIFVAAADGPQLIATARTPAPIHLTTLYGFISLPPDVVLLNIWSAIGSDGVRTGAPVFLL